jgi:hypothetical protein
MRHPLPTRRAMYPRVCLSMCQCLQTDAPMPWHPVLSRNVRAVVFGRCFRKVQQSSGRPVHSAVLWASQSQRQQDYIFALFNAVAILSSRPYVRGISGIRRRKRHMQKASCYFLMVYSRLLSGHHNHLTTAPLHAINFSA